MTESSVSAICRPIAQLRRELEGPRGKSAFARRLDLSPSTYDYYENGRVPPADVLVRIADTCGVDLRWLLTGESARSDQLPADHPALQRASRLLADRPHAGQALAAFVEILIEAGKFPRKIGKSEQVPAGADSPDDPPGQDRADASGYRTPQASWIPILGRSAAGVPAFWADGGDGDGTATIGQMIARFAGRAPDRQKHHPVSGQGELGQLDVQYILVPPAATDEVPVEFVACQDCKQRFPDSFALRIDGDSMSPEIEHGDLVLASPSAPAVDGRAAIVQLSGQIGVTCKLFRRDGETVHLVAINEQVAPVTVPAETVEWALRVLARVKL